MASSGELLRCDSEVFIRTVLVNENEGFGTKNSFNLNFGIVAAVA